MVPAATRTWDGEAGDDNWSSPMNWSDNTVPVAEDTVIFNGTSVKTCVLDVAVDIAEVRIEATYAGLLQLDESLTLKSSMSQAGGWIGGSGQLTVAANATFTWS